MANRQSVALVRMVLVAALIAVAALNAATATAAKAKVAVPAAASPGSPTDDPTSTSAPRTCWALPTLGLPCYAGNAESVHLNRTALDDFSANACYDVAHHRLEVTVVNKTCDARVRLFGNLENAIAEGDTARIAAALTRIGVPELTAAVTSFNSSERKVDDDARWRAWQHLALHGHGSPLVSADPGDAIADAAVADGRYGPASIRVRLAGPSLLVANGRLLPWKRQASHWPCRYHFSTKVLVGGEYWLEILLLYADYIAIRDPVQYNATFALAEERHTVSRWLVWTPVNITGRFPALGDFLQWQRTQVPRMKSCGEQIRQGQPWHGLWVFHDYERLVREGQLAASVAWQLIRSSTVGVNGKRHGAPALEASTGAASSAAAADTSARPSPAEQPGPQLLLPTQEILAGPKLGLALSEALEKTYGNTSGVEFLSTTCSMSSMSAPSWRSKWVRERWIAFSGDSQLRETLHAASAVLGGYTECYKRPSCLTRPLAAAPGSPAYAHEVNGISRRFHSINNATVAPEARADRAGDLQSNWAPQGAPAVDLLLFGGAPSERAACRDLRSRFEREWNKYANVSVASLDAASLRTCVGDGPDVLVFNVGQHVTRFAMPSYRERVSFLVNGTLFLRGLNDQSFPGRQRHLIWMQTYLFPLRQDKNILNFRDARTPARIDTMNRVAQRVINQVNGVQGAGEPIVVFDPSLILAPLSDLSRDQAHFGVLQLRAVTHVLYDLIVAMSRDGKARGKH